MIIRVLGPTWRPKGAQDAPKRPQGSIFTDLYRFGVDFATIFNGFRKILDVLARPASCAVLTRVGAKTTNKY